MKLRAFFFLSVFLLTAAIPTRRQLPPQAGEVVLYFNGGTAAISQITFKPPFGTRPIVLCSANNELDAGVRVACQGLTGEVGGVSAEVDAPRLEPLTVQWLAMEATQ